MKYCIYKLCDNKDLLYVGKTNDFYKRLYHHRISKIWANEITHIEFAECKNRIDMDIYEKYYINKLKPKYNEASVYNETPTFKIDELDFIRYEMKDYIKENNGRNAELQLIYRNHKHVNRIINEPVRERSECLREGLTFTEAAEEWGMDTSTLRKLAKSNRIKEIEEYRKSGNVWLITRSAMIRIYGEPKNK